MVKSKKLSRGSLAVLLLALLLAVSMVVGLTGAWFTDKDNGNSEKTFTFGSVSLAVDDTNMDRFENQTTFNASKDLYLPGDKVAVEPSKFHYSGTGDAYVYYGYKLEILAKVQEITAINAQGEVTYGSAQWVELKNAVTSLDSSVAEDAFAKTSYTYNESTHQYEEGNSVVEDQSRDSKLQLIAPGAADVPFAGYVITFNKKVNNYVYKGSTRVVLNLGMADHTPAEHDLVWVGPAANNDPGSETLLIRVTVFAAAIQAKNVTLDDFNAWFHGVAGDDYVALKSLPVATAKTVAEINGDNQPNG